MGISWALPSLLDCKDLKAQKGRSGGQSRKVPGNMWFSKYERSKLNVMYIMKEKLPLLSTFYNQFPLHALRATSQMFEDKHIEWWWNHSWQISRVIVHREPIKQKKVSFTIHIMSYTHVQSLPISSIKMLINHSRTCLKKVSNWTALILMKVVLDLFWNSVNKM